MRIHKEGYNTIALVFFVVLIGGGLICAYLSEVPVFVCLLMLLIFLGLVIYFFRYPERSVQADDSIVLSPCDGKVVVIEKVEEKEFLQTDCIQVSIFMSPLNVHINWYSISGMIKYMKYHPGKFLVAFHPKSSELNERTTVVVEDKRGRLVLFRQIAGAVARRIVCYAKEGSQVAQGDQLGFIKFGSRVDVFLPLDADIKVQLGQKVKGNITNIATFKEIV